MKSCIYEGWVKHQRYQPVEHSFRNKMFLLYLDLDEIDTVFQKHWLWSSKRPALARFKRSDHYGDPNLPLDQTIRNLIEDNGYNAPDGPIRLLTHLRYFGYVFNPVSFYYCFDKSENLEFVVAHVTNTPWKESHCYVIPPAQFSADRDETLTEKVFHVSPFMPMDMGYRWRVTPPKENLAIRISNFKNSNHKTERAAFEATMHMSKRQISSWQLSRVLLRYPVMTAQVVGNIYFQALRLWLKKCPTYLHPNKTNLATTNTDQSATEPLDSLRLAKNEIGKH